MTRLVILLVIIFVVVFIYTISFLIIYKPAPNKPMPAQERRDALGDPHDYVGEP